MKVVLLGGASFSTPALFQAMQGDFEGCEFVLVGRSAKNLNRVARASRLLTGEHAPHISPIVCDPESAEDALKAANVVVIQMRIGNMPGRGFDESFPLCFGLCGDEGLGPGGVSAAWRSWSTMDQWLEAIRRWAPRALVLMMSSPVGILTRCAHMRFPELNCLGICEVPYVTLREICSVLGVNFTSITFEYLGVNHIGWLYGIKAGDRDLTDEWASLRDAKGFPPRDIIRHWEGVPTKYLRLHFEPDSVLAAQRAAPIPRAVELEQLQNAALSVYESGTDSQVRQSLSKRSTPWYSDSIVPLLRGLHIGESRGPFFLSGPNQGYTAACAADDILEIGCRVEDGAIKRIASVLPPPALIATLVSEFCQHERLAADAVLAGQRSMLETALLAQPWVARAVASEPGLPHVLAELIVSGNVRDGDAFRFPH
jgi:6-phospho-beta-glucosidase